MNMSKVPPGCRCESGSADGLGDGGGAGEASDSLDGAGVGELSDSADGIRSECDGDGDDNLVGTPGLLRKESRPLILSRIDSNRFGMVDEAIARSRR